MTVERVANAALRANRSPEEITIIGVSKYVDVDKTRELFEAGCHDLGESRPQVLWEKAAALSDLPIRWHLIGIFSEISRRERFPLFTRFTR